MKRGISLALSLLLVFSIALSGCGAQKEQAGNTQGASTEVSGKNDDVKLVITPQLIGNENAKIEITWQPVPAHWMSDSNKNKVEYLTKKATEWAEKHPEVKIKVADTSVNINDAMAKTLIQLASGQAVDMSAIDSFMFPNFSSKYSQPLDDIVKEKGLDINDWFPFAQKVMKPSDKILGLWYTTDVRVLFYRKDLITTPPKTWDEVLTIGKEMVEKGYEGFLYSGGRDEAVTMNTLPYFWGQGGKLVDDSGNAIFGEGKNREYMTNYFSFLKTTVDSGITPSRVVNFKTDPDMVKDLATGKVAMFVGNNNMAAQLRSAIGEKFDELWDVAQIPMAESGARMSSAGGWVQTVFTNDEQKRKLGADFLISLYVDDAGMEGWCTAGGYLPPRKSVFDKAEVFKTDKIAAKFKEELQYANVRPSAAIYPTISQQIQIAISALLTDKAYTPEKAVEDVWNTVKNAK